jgi:hypothetical protein
MMKTLLILLILGNPLDLRANEDIVRDTPADQEQEEIVQDPILIRALARLEKRMAIQFNIPFPADLDIDVYRKRPLALITLAGSKVCATRPIVNPYDEPRTVEWMIGPAELTKLGKEGIDCSFDVDERGEFCRVNLLADWASDGTGNHQINRSGDETGPIFFERARLTYQSRARNAKDPALAALFLEAFEKIATTVQALRKEEAHAIPGDAPK